MNSIYNASIIPRSCHPSSYSKKSYIQVISSYDENVSILVAAKTFDKMNLWNKMVMDAKPQFLRKYIKLEKCVEFFENKQIYIKIADVTAKTGLTKREVVEGLQTQSPLEFMYRSIRKIDLFSQNSNYFQIASTEVENHEQSFQNESLIQKSKFDFLEDDLTLTENENQEQEYHENIEISYRQLLKKGLVEKEGEVYLPQDLNRPMIKSKELKSHLVNMYNNGTQVLDLDRFTFIMGYDVSEGKLFFKRMGRELGSGSFGKVFAVANIRNDKLDVLKLSRASQVKHSQSIENEYEVLNSIHKDGFVEGIQKPPRRIIMINDSHHPENNLIGYFSPRYNKGDLLDHILSQNSFKEQYIFECLEGFYKIALGVDHLHKKKLIHQDIKPENIYLDVNPITNEVCYSLADFGDAFKFSGSDANTQSWMERGIPVVTREYALYQDVKDYSKIIQRCKALIAKYELTGDEKLLKQIKNLKKHALLLGQVHDVFSLGMSLYVALSRGMQLPFEPNKNGFSTCKNPEDYNEILDVSAETNEMIKNMLGLNPHGRVDMSTVLVHYEHILKNEYTNIWRKIQH